MWTHLCNMDPVTIILYLVIAAVTIITIRLSTCMPQYREGHTTTLKNTGSICTMVYWGSGGHTTEMIHLLNNLDAEKYYPMTFVTSNSDKSSEDKIRSAKLSCSRNATWKSVCRSREVKQSWVSTLITSFLSFIDCFLLVLKCRPQLILCNGPGTCVLICYSAFILRLLGVYQPIIVYVESFCRVKSLSLSGKLIYPIADKFIVQWRGLMSDHSRAEYLGRIC